MYVFMCLCVSPLSSWGLYIQFTEVQAASVLCINKEVKSHSNTSLPVVDTVVPRCLAFSLHPAPQMQCATSLSTGTSSTPMAPLPNETPKRSVLSMNLWRGKCQQTAPSSEFMALQNSCFHSEFKPFKMYFFLIGMCHSGRIYMLEWTEFACHSYIYLFNMWEAPLRIFSMYRQCHVPQCHQSFVLK